MSRWLWLLLAISIPSLALAQDEELIALIRKTQAALKDQELDAALDLAQKCVKLDGKSSASHFILGEVYAARRESKDAIEEYNRVLELEPTNVTALDHRGGEYFKQGKIEDCITDFEKYLKARPAAYPAHWRYGIACYYAGRFADGVKQFKAGEVEFGDDVENIFWHYLCNARIDGAEKAREKMLKLEGIKQDTRIPMMDILALIQDKSTPEKVLAAVTKAKLPANAEKEALFYANLYIGLNYEALGNAAKAKEHLEAADKLQISHYMWDVGHTDLLLRKMKTK